MNACVCMYVNVCAFLNYVHMYVCEYVHVRYV